MPFHRWRRYLMRLCAAVAYGVEKKVHAALGEALRAKVPPDALAEALLQSILFVGFPRVINAFWRLRTLVPRVPPSWQAPRAPSRWRRRGERLCRQVYGDRFEEMIQRMRSLHPQLAEWILVDGYGKVLSHTNVPILERELWAISCLLAQKAWRQLSPHLHAVVRFGISKKSLEDLLMDLEGALPDSLVERGLRTYRRGLTNGGSGKGSSSNSKGSRAAPPYSG